MVSKLSAILASSLIFLTLIACSTLISDPFSVATSTTTPKITISTPKEADTLQVRTETKIQSTSVDSDGIAKVELFVNNELVRVDANPSPQNGGTPYIVAQPWTPRVSGFYVIQVRSYDSTGAIGESQQLTIEVVENLVTVPTPTPQTATPTPTNTPTPELNLAASTPTPLKRFPTPTPSETPIVLNLPSPTPTPTVGRFDPTGFEPQNRFRNAWEIVGGARGRLGYPLTNEVEYRDFAKQRFERGEMFWWDTAEGPDFFWVIDSYTTDVNSGRTWNSYSPSWPEGAVEYYNCHEALVNGEIGPRYGFGKLWCDRLELQVRLGNPVEWERGSAGNPPLGELQFFQGGLMLYDPGSNDLIVMFSQGDWLRLVF